jgi:hypothetical protein
MKGLKFLKFWLFIGWIQIGLVILLSLVPSPEVLPDLEGTDKLMHFSVYGFVMFWFGLCYFPGRSYNLMGLGIILMGVVLEFIQSKTSYRSMSCFDMAANALGVSFGWALARTRVSEALICFEKALTAKHQ